MAELPQGVQIKASQQVHETGYEGWCCRIPEEEGWFEGRGKKKKIQEVGGAIRKPRKKSPQKKQEIEEALEKTMQGGAIRKPRKRSPKKKQEIDEALEKTMQGGAIRKPRKRSPKKKQDIEEALDRKMQGGKIKFHDPIHKYVHPRLSGRGGRFDSPFVREKMHQLMSAYHPSIFHSYLSGRVQDVPSDPHYDFGGAPQRVRHDPRPTVVDSGGSMRALTHSENGFLQSFDSTFYSHSEIV